MPRVMIHSQARTDDRMLVMKRWMIMLFLMLLASGCSATDRRPWMGANVKVSEHAPWGSEAAQLSLRNLSEAGADVGLLVAFVWQDSLVSMAPVLGSDSTSERVRAGLRQMRAAGLRPVLKVHLWVPGHWAGEVDPVDQAAWFSSYQQALLRLAEAARDEQAEAFVVGTELRRLENAPQWPALVAAVRKVYGGKVVYVADGIEQAESFRYWPLFDAIGTSLYPALPAASRQREAAMASAASRLQALAGRQHRPLWVAELGLRSAKGSLKAPWESPEQRTADVDAGLQARVLAEWKRVLTRYGVAGIGIWCWYTDPDAGGAGDSDFTVQNKPAQAVFGRPSANGTGRPVGPDGMIVP